jgi:hypothetical protein
VAWFACQCQGLRVLCIRKPHVMSQVRCISHLNVKSPLHLKVSGLKVSCLMLPHKARGQGRCQLMAGWRCGSGSAPGHLASRKLPSESCRTCCWNGLDMERSE